MSCHGNASAPTSQRSGTDTLTPLLKVLLVGGPNVGKSTLFNSLTGAKQRTMHAPGTTVELAAGTWRTAVDERAIIDLPGSYSLLARSADEQVSSCSPTPCAWRLLPSSGACSAGGPPEVPRACAGCPLVIPRI